MRPRPAPAASPPGCRSTRRSCARPNARRSCARSTRPGRKGCTPAQVGECIYGSWYLLDTDARKGAVRERQADCARGNGKEPLRGQLQAAAGAKVKAVRVNPGTVLVQAHPEESARGKVGNTSPNSWYVINDEPVLNGADITNPQQGFDEGGGGTGQPNVTFGFTSHGKSGVRTGHQENRPTRPGSPAAGRRQGSGAAALRGRARRPADHRAVDRLHEVPGRDRRVDRLGDLRRLHDHDRAEPRERAAVRRAADQARADLALAGLGDARQTGAQAGPDRGPRRLRDRLPVPARSSTACSARSPSAAWSSTASTSSR